MILSVSSVAGIAIDVAIVLLLAVFAIIGLRKGFFKSVLSMLSTLVVLIISIIGAGPLANLINKIYDFSGLMAGKICKSIAGMGGFYSTAIPEGVSGADIVKNIPSNTNGFLKKLMSYVLKPLSASEIKGATVAEIVSGAFASIIMTIIAGVLLFILIKIAIGLISKLFDNITRNRVFGATNKLLGAGFGAVKGMVIVVMFATVLTFMTVIPFVNTKVSPVIQNNTSIAKPIYNFTDKMVEKYVVDGKVIQKWVDKLWDNKYKGGADEPAPTPSTPDGTQGRPYTTEITETSVGVYNVNITIDFTSSTEQYYSLKPQGVLYANFNLSFVTDAGYEVYNSDDLNTVLTDLTQLYDNEDFIIKFTKTGQENTATAQLTLTQNKI